MPVPKYRQIAGDLQRRIESGEFPSGAQMPAETELMSHYGASRNTVREAIRWLAARGLAESRAGQGTFAAPERDMYLTVLPGDVGGGPSGEKGPFTLGRPGGRRAPVLSAPDVGIEPAGGLIAARLYVPDGTQVVARRQECYIDGDAWSLRTSYYPLDLALRGAPRLLRSEAIDEGAVQYLTDVLGLEQCGHRNWIGARIPEESEAAFLGVPPSGSVFEIFHAAFGPARRALRLTVAVFAAAGNQFVMDIGDTPPGM